MIGKIPDDLKNSIDRYVNNGCPTGGFLEACIENNLKEAVGRADERNLRLLPEIVAYLYNDCPAYCWGFTGAFDRWVSLGGLRGFLNAGRQTSNAHLGAEEAD